MARPKLSDGARRSERIVFCVTPAERLQGETQALAAGLSGAHDYARQQFLHGKVVVRQTRSLDHAAFDQLAPPLIYPKHRLRRQRVCRQ